MRSVACGTAPVLIDVQSCDGEGLYDQLCAAKEQGCVAFLIEMVRSSDGHPLEAATFKAIATQSERAGLPLVVDECLTALRCGAPFACQRREYISVGRPDFVLFGKGLQVCGVSMNHKGACVQKYFEHSLVTAEQATLSWQSLVTKAVPVPMLIDSLNIIERAIQHDWPSRSQLIGRHLRDIISESIANTAKDSSTTDMKPKIGGLDALIYLPQEISQKLLVMSAGNTGSPIARWLPLMDDLMTRRLFLHQYIFGPRSVVHRQKLAEQYEKDGLRPLWCLYCGVKTVGPAWCRTCCIGRCEDSQCTIAYQAHTCLESSKI